MSIKENSHTSLKSMTLKEIAACNPLRKSEVSSNKKSTRYQFNDDMLDYFGILNFLGVYEDVCQIYSRDFDVKQDLKSVFWQIFYSVFEVDNFVNVKECCLLCTLLEKLGLKFSFAVDRCSDYDLDDYIAEEDFEKYNEMEIPYYSEDHFNWLKENFFDYYDIKYTKHEDLEILTCPPVNGRETSMDFYYLRIENEEFYWVIDSYCEGNMSIESLVDFLVDYFPFEGIALYGNITNAILKIISATKEVLL